MDRIAPWPVIGNCEAIEGPHPLDHFVIICGRERPIDSKAIVC